MSIKVIPPLTRLRAYKEIRAELMMNPANRPLPFLCARLAGWVCKRLPEYKIDGLLVWVTVAFPELERRRPKGMGCAGWWPINDYESRIQALDMCIQEVKSIIYANNQNRTDGPGRNLPTKEV